MIEIISYPSIMSYAGMLRNTITSDSYPPSASSDCDSKSVAAKTVTDKLYLDLNDLDKGNARIKRQILTFSTLEKGDRIETRELLQ